MKALIIVDLQDDFCPGGALAVKNGDEIVPIINKLLPNFDLIIFTMDWHELTNKGFASQYNLKPFEQIDGETVWPDHCVQNTLGAQLHSGIDFSKCKKDFYIFKKGAIEHPYSAFGEYETPDEELPELTHLLDKHGVTDIFVCGLALDYCVRDTAVDGSNWYGTTVIIDACRSISEDIKPTLQEFLDNDIAIVNSTDPDLFNIL